MKDYDDLFFGLRFLPGEYHIEVDPSVKPVQHVPRGVPVPLITKLKEKIDDMENLGIIVKDNLSTECIGKLCVSIAPARSEQGYLEA